MSAFTGLVLVLFIANLAFIITIRLIGLLTVPLWSSDRYVFWLHVVSGALYGAWMAAIARFHAQVLYANSHEVLAWITCIGAILCVGSFLSRNVDDAKHLGPHDSAYLGAIFANLIGLATYLFTAVVHPRAMPEDVLNVLARFSVAGEKGAQSTVFCVVAILVAIPYAIRALIYLPAALVTLVVGVSVLVSFCRGKLGGGAERHEE